MSFEKLLKTASPYDVQGDMMLQLYLSLIENQEDHSLFEQIYYKYYKQMFKVAFSIIENKEKFIFVEDNKKLEDLPDLSDQDFTETLCSKSDYDKLTSTINSLHSRYTETYYTFITFLK